MILVMYVVLKILVMYVALKIKDDYVLLNLKYWTLYYFIIHFIIYFEFNSLNLKAEMIKNMITILLFLGLLNFCILSFASALVFTFA